MEIKQFEDKELAQYGYAILSGNEMAVIDPARDPQPYFDFAKERNASIRAVIETHPHADFVSSHLEIHDKSGATIYVSKLLGSDYPHKSFDEGDTIKLGRIRLKALNTPGHSPDSISIVALNESGKEISVFTGDTLFIGDCGRPDLREKAGAITAAKAELSRQMYHSLRNKLMLLPDEVLVYPGHGAGSLCGKSMSEENRSTIGAEKLGNWSLQKMSEEDFVKELLADQPFIPRYFPYDVAVNKKGAGHLQESLAKVPWGETINSATAANEWEAGIVVIDSRPREQFEKSNFSNAINLMAGQRFETWLGSIINPGEKFYLVAENEKALRDLIYRTAKIGYEKQIEKAFVANLGSIESKKFDAEELRTNADAYTIVDIRNHAEVKARKIFNNAIRIPLYELRERVNEIPLDKPIVVHCAGGYRSAAGASMIKSRLNGKVKVYDLSDEVGKF